MKSLTIVFLLLFATQAIAQTDGKTGTITVKKNSDAMLVYDTEYLPRGFILFPEYPGGERALEAFIKKNIRIPEKVKQKRINVICFTSFIVTKTGEICGIEVHQLPRYSECVDEAIRLVKLMGPWTPGVAEGAVANIRIHIKIEFK
ncbi:MAG: energy transducer TonB [Bacteroidetes bacterium]|nr:energy transducer TonB [Bacteroidota bacterium]